MFFPLPDGQAIVFNLVGISTAAPATVLESQQFKAKMTSSYVISVKNWLKET